MNKLNHERNVGLSNMIRDGNTRVERVCKELEIKKERI